MKVEEFLPGDTMLLTWVFSGYDVSNLNYRVRNSADTITSTGTFTDSGNGHAFALVTVSSNAGYYVAEYHNVIDGFPYVRRRQFRVQAIEVD
jgi:hypothetical protein